MESPEMNQDFVRPRNNRNFSTDTLCAFCGNACNSGCSWSESFTPVEGWIAQENKRGYFVFDCPKFVHDKRIRKNAQELDNDGCIALMNAIISTMRQDYIEDPKARKPIENFVFSEKHRNLFWFCDPVEMIEQFRREIR